MPIQSLIKRISQLFPKPPIHTKREMKDRERAIISRYAQGNASLQIGRYITTKEIEQRKEELSSYDFLPKVRS